jgi:hypothetical protein
MMYRGSLIKRSLEPLHCDLLKMKYIMCEKERRESVHVLDQVRWMVWYKSELENFGAKLPVHRESLCVMAELTEEQTRTQRRDSVFRLDSLREELVKTQKSGGQGQVVLERSIRETGEDAKTYGDTSTGSSTVDILRQDRDDSVVYGPSGMMLSWSDSEPFASLDGGDLKKDAWETRPSFRLDVFKESASSDGTIKIE